MRVLILTCNTGEGHNSSATALKESFFTHGHSCDIVDALCFISEKTSEFISGWHTRIYRHLPKVFGSGYSYAENHPSLFEDRKLVSKCLAPGVERLHTFLENDHYDHIVCVHVFSALLVTELRQRYGMLWGASFLATDYTCSPIVGDTDMDIYFIPHEGLIPEFEENRVPSEKLASVGIPVRHAFFEQADKPQAKKLLGIPADRRTVFLMGGSMGCGPIEELALALSEALPDDTVLMVACGTNEKLLNILRKKASETLVPFGYSDRIPLIMSGVELFLTKPGGISITEAAVKHLPMLLIDTVGGCEARNLDYFTAQGWANAAGTLDEVVLRCVKLLNDPAILDTQSQALCAAFQRNPAELICEYVITWEQEASCS
jgi:processive 1,2-diacylglycerol beta-glucosyltransferase